MSGQSPSITARLADRLARPVPAAMKQRAALHVLDWAGCAIAGAHGAAGRAVSAGLAVEGRGRCSLAANPRTATPLAAAMINGAVGNVLEMDDVDKRAILHPGPTVIPAALAAAETAGLDAAEFLAAVVRGYEAVIGLGRAVGPGHYAFWHNTGTCGPFGAAAAAASAFRLDPGATAHALGLAGTQASGFWQTRHEPGSMAKQLHTARAAHAGLSAAMLASAGLTGPLAILEGAQGFFAATCPGADPEAVLDDHGADWLISQVSFKPWPACRHAHAAIDAALAAWQAGVTAGDVERAVVTTYPDAVTFCDRAAPESVIEAKFSIQHSVAAALIFGRPALSHFEPGISTRTDMRDLAARIDVAAGEPYAGRYPARYGAGLSLTLRDGSMREFDAPDALGDPENPLAEADIVKKAAMLAGAGGFSAAQAEALSAAALALAEGGPLDRFAAAMSQTPEGEMEARS
ncbi:MAG: MmgE/PrpD family protein [Oceanicaulis sp.]